MVCWQFPAVKPFPRARVSTGGVQPFNLNKPLFTILPLILNSRSHPWLPLHSLVAFFLVCGCLQPSLISTAVIGKIDMRELAA